LQDYLIAIDIGTTSAKGFSISTSGEILYSHQQFYLTSFNAEGFAEQDPELIYNAVTDLIRKSVILTDRCLGISFSAAMHSLTAIDGQGQVIIPLAIWSDTRSKIQSQKIKDEGLAQRFYEITGTPVHPMSPLCKLMWLKEHRPEVFNKTHKFLSIKEYVFFRMTGECVVDHSTASATGLFDIEKLKWSSEILSYLNLTKELLSVPVTVDQQFFIRKEHAADLGLDQKTPLVIGASDGCLAQLGSNALGSDDLTVTLGTSGAVRVASSSRKLDPQGRVFNYILNEKVFICGGATNCGSVLIDWFKKSMDLTAPDDINEFAKQACQVPAGSMGLLCVPFLLGERAPIYNPDASGTFVGIKMHHTKSHFQRALLEGICFEIKWILETVETNFGKRNNIILSGGITRSPVFTQLLCDILGRKIVAHTGRDASSAGAARLGFEALKIKFEMPKAELSSYKPDVSLRALYEKYFSAFIEIYERLKDFKL
jgi:gluconokinase